MWQKCPICNGTGYMDYTSLTRITEQWLLDRGFVKNELDYEIEIGRKGFIVARAQDEDLLLLYRPNTGFPYYELRFIEHTHELELVVLALTDKTLTLRA